MRRLGFAVAALLLALRAGAADADVVFAPAEGFTNVEPLGRLTMSRTYGPRLGKTCVADGAGSTGCRLIAAAAEWSPPDLPITLQLERRGGAFALLLSTRLQDPKGRAVCWSRRELSEAETSSAARMLSAVEGGIEAWSRECAPIRGLGVDAVRLAFADVRPDLGRAYPVLRGVTGLPATPAEMSIDSFLPSKVSQPLLDAVAAACGGPPGQARLEADGRITWDFDRTVAYGADGSRPFGVCVDDQIRHYPGYQRRN
ncbi:hypothetical protein [Caulobacter endophyticus]|uniref:Uncharacterized protein n=1 Tax=Caulobacter endophyticus TaxID=2172652 RepID=A0A2T9K2H2_9CAUL|nr:hypothetical protein [Caulobacter endophyticus]PVM90165.1 hypothetical protein DDF67_11215 [Caulobacter endophyticus]